MQITVRIYEVSCDAEPCENVFQAQAGDWYIPHPEIQLNKKQTVRTAEDAHKYARYLGWRLSRRGDLCPEHAEEKSK